MDARTAIAIALALMGESGPPPSIRAPEAPVSQETKADPVPLQKKAVIQQRTIQQKAVIQGYDVHSHRCPRCGYVWTHDHRSFGSVLDHLCPLCASGPQWNRFK